MLINEMSGLTAQKNYTLLQDANDLICQCGWLFFFQVIDKLHSS